MLWRFFGGNSPGVISPRVIHRREIHLGGIILTTDSTNDIKRYISFNIQDYRNVFRTQSNIWDGVFAKILEALTIFGKISILDVRLDCEYISRIAF